MLKVWMLPNVCGGHRRGSDWLSFLLLGQNTRDPGLYGQRGLFSSSFCRVEVQDCSATCDRSLMFHFNMWKNKRTVTQRTKSKGQPDLTTTALTATNSVPTVAFFSGVGWGCGERQADPCSLPGAVSLMQNRILCMRRRA